jgi:hypothetical protein
MQEASQDSSISEAVIDDSQSSLDVYPQRTELTLDPCFNCNGTSLESLPPLGLPSSLVAILKTGLTASLTFLSLNGLFASDCPSTIV